jgi:pimeloyl-ACP methyl ester carboxylesterase
LALLAATKYPQFGAVVAAVPSSVVWPGLSADENDPIAWTWRGKPVPQVSGSDDEFSKVPTRPLPGGKSKAAIYTPTFEAQIKDPKEVARAAIPVEKIHGPVLLLGGEADELWPSAKFARMAWDRLHAAKHPYPDQMATFPDAGHGLCGLPGHPTTFEFAQDNGGWMSFGGTAAGNAAAQTQALQDIDKFLDKNLASGKLLN